MTVSRTLTGLIGAVGGVIEAIIVLAVVSLTAGAGSMAPEIQEIFNSINY